MLRQQAFAFIFSLTAGFAAGLIFDVYQVARRLLGLRKIGTAIGDVLAWLLIAISAFVMLMIGNWAELRLYVLVTLVIGLALYIKVFSSMVQIMVLKLFLGVHWAIRTIIRIIIFPYRLLLKILAYPVAAVRWTCLLIVRIVEYALSYPQLGIQSLIRNRKQPPPGL